MTRPADDRGESLVEIVVALAILSLGITTLVGALGVNASSTVTNRSSSQLESTLLSAAEHVKALPFTTTCTGSLTWQPVSSTEVPRDPAFDVRFRSAHRFGDDTAACDPSASLAAGDELAAVRIEVEGDGFAPRSVDVVIRRELS